MELDTEDLRRFGLEMETLGRVIPAQAAAVVAKGALNIKNDQQEQMQKSRYFGAVARSINYDLETTPTATTAIIGPRKGPGQPGALANIAYFGGAHGGGGTVEDPEEALKREEPKFIAAVRALGGILG